MTGPPSIFFKNHYEQELIATANAISTRGKGLLASDERMQNIHGKFAKIGIPNTEENRRRYRELLYTTPGIENYISGVIMNDETLYHQTKDGTSFVETLRKVGVFSGVKLDKGVRSLPYKPGEVYGQGITDLDSRAKQHYQQGARFAKFRVVLQINNGYISECCIKDSAWALGKYAAICQVNGLVPIIEPELLMDGDHSIEVCQYWTEKILAATFKALSDQEVILEATLLKPNMVLAGNEFKGTRSPTRNAVCTLQALKRTVPTAVPGILFLSGGQTEEQATVNLNAIASVGNLPWNVSFSFGRALQLSCLDVWKGDDTNMKAAQQMFLSRAKANSEAEFGQYKGSSKL